MIFKKDKHITTIIGSPIDTHGEEKIFKSLNSFVIPFIDPEAPNLHHCAKDAPPLQLMDTFAKFYSSAIFLRDKYGRTLRQAELASGNKTFAKNAYFFVNIIDAELRVADPKDDLYPFTMAASSMLHDDTNYDVLTPQVPRYDLSAVCYNFHWNIISKTSSTY